MFSFGSVSGILRHYSKSSASIGSGGTAVKECVRVPVPRRCSGKAGVNPMAEKWRKKFEEERSRLNEIILSGEHLGIKRYFALDEQAYLSGALPAKVKELIGLVASLVLRCDECVSYHLVRCRDEGVTREEFDEAFNIALVVSGSIVIPHLRLAAERLESLLEK